MRALLALCSVILPACLSMSTGSPDGGSSSAGGGDAGGATEDGGTGGTGCGTDPLTGVTLCLATNACPGRQIDPGAFPSCGFRQGGPSALDLECVCAGGYLCPIGVPTSCDAAAQLLGQEGSSLQVCQQVSTGGCINLADGGGVSSSSGASSSGSGSSGSSSGTTLSGACQACLSGCGSTPACYEACGC
jgi:hypothetical protein